MHESTTEPVVNRSGNRMTDIFPPTYYQDVCVCVYSSNIFFLFLFRLERHCDCIAVFFAPSSGTPRRNDAVRCLTGPFVGKRRIFVIYVL